MLGMYTISRVTIQTDEAKILEVVCKNAENMFPGSVIEDSQKESTPFQISITLPEEEYFEKAIYLLVQPDPDNEAVEISLMKVVDPTLITQATGWVTSDEVDKKQRLLDALTKGLPGKKPKKQMRSIYSNL